MFAWRDRLGAEEAGAVGLAVTDRFGGVSAGPYAELNLGDHVGDQPSAVQVNRRRLSAALGVPPDRLVVMRQVHGAQVREVDAPVAGAAPEADALVTRTPGLVLAVLVADCTPVLLADPAQGVVGVAHAGRRGLVAGVVVGLLEAMQGLGARGIVARVGPSICGRCYEVPAGMQEEVTAVVPQARSRTRADTPGLDIAAGVMAQLEDSCSDVQRVPGCTYERDDLYSHRRAGGAPTGRFAGLVQAQAR